MTIDPASSGATARTIERALLIGALLVAIPAAGQTAATPPAAQASIPGAQPAGPEAPELGRLFFTPVERAELDELRRRPPSPPKTDVAAAKPEPPAPPPTPKYVTLNGVVRRSDGVTTVWLNDKPVRDQHSDEGLVVSTPSRSGPPGHVVVRVPQSGRSVDLKVGQQLEVNSGQVQEAYETPRTAALEPKTVEPPPAAPPSQSAPSLRRPNRERDLLRELLREIGEPPGGQNQSAKPVPSEPPR